MDSDGKHGRTVVVLIMRRLGGKGGEERRGEGEYSAPWRPSWSSACVHHKPTNVASAEKFLTGPGGFEV